SENKQVVLTYNRDFVNIQPEQYSLMIQNIAGITGVPVSDQTISFDFQEDVIPPDIEDLEVLSENEIKLIFDENITEASALDLSKYTIEVPAGFESNMISNLELINQNQLHITFENELVNSNLKYFIYIKGITDVSGNTNPKIESSFSLTEITDLKFVEIYPNPLRIKEMEGVRFMNLPLDKQGNIWIYNFSGELVFSDNFSPLNEQDFNYYEWKAVNNRFNKVSSGTYFYVLKMQDEIKKGTIVLIR
ncbi:MAG: gliding motility-associated C-terminal domain-containing protein, partial [Candidatus Cloacimonadota bacterium]|nr:gliding motility-associated C-terminal domain-containing protein [Candidatus Cloacimonadota bacterium]